MANKSTLSNLNKRVLNTTGWVTIGKNHSNIADAALITSLGYGEYNSTKTQVRITNRPAFIASLNKSHAKMELINGKFVLVIPQIYS